jgi:hypothetical protein
MNYQDKFDGNGTSTIFMLTGMPVDPMTISAEFDGYAKQFGKDFCVQTNYVIFIEAPNPGQDNIVVNYDGNPLE